MLVSSSSKDILLCSPQVHDKVTELFGNILLRYVQACKLVLLIMSWFRAYYDPYSEYKAYLWLIIPFVINNIIYLEPEGH